MNNVETVEMRTSSRLRWEHYNEYRNPSDHLRGKGIVVMTAKEIPSSFRAVYIKGDNYKDGATYARAVMRSL